MPEPKFEAQHTHAFLAQFTTAFAEGDPQADAKQAETANMKLLEDQYRAIGAGDFAAALALYADDVEMEIDCPPPFAFAGRWKGRGPVAEAMGRNFSLVAGQKPVIESVVAQGDTVVVVGRETGKYLPTDQEYEVGWVQLHTIREGQIVRFREIVGQAIIRDQPVG